MSLTEAFTHEDDLLTVDNNVGSFSKACLAESRTRSRGGVWV